MKFLILICLICIGYFCLFLSFRKILTNKLLREHQLEWNKIKSNMKKAGKTDTEIFSAYAVYIKQLQNGLCGKYIPKY